MSHPAVLLAEPDDGRSVTLRVGEAVGVSLPENASTGYRWAVESLDPGTIEALDPIPHYGSATVGSAGVVEWRFLAKAPGTTTVVLKLWRHWEGDKSIIRRFRFQASVTP